MNRTLVFVLIVLFFGLLASGAYARGETRVLTKLLINEELASDYESSIRYGQEYAHPLVMIPFAFEGYLISNNVVLQTSGYMSAIQFIKMDNFGFNIETKTFNLCKTGTLGINGKYAEPLQTFIDQIVVANQDKYSESAFNKTKKTTGYRYVDWIKNVACGKDENANKDDTIKPILEAVQKDLKSNLSTLIDVATTQNFTFNLSHRFKGKMIANKQMVLPYSDYFAGTLGNWDMGDNSIVKLDPAVRYVLSCWDNSGNNVIYDGLVAKEGLAVNQSKSKYLIPEEISSPMILKKFINKKAKLFCANKPYVLGLFFKRGDIENAKTLQDKEKESKKLSLIMTYTSATLANAWIDDVFNQNQCLDNTGQAIADDTPCVLQSGKAGACKAGSCTESVVIDKSCTKEGDSCTYDVSGESYNGFCNSTLNCVACFKQEHCGQDRFCNLKKNTCETKKDFGEKCETADNCKTNWCQPVTKICTAITGNECEKHSDCKGQKRCEVQTSGTKKCVDANCVDKDCAKLNTDKEAYKCEKSKESTEYMQCVKRPFTPAEQKQLLAAQKAKEDKITRDRVALAAQSDIKIVLEGKFGKQEYPLAASHKITPNIILKFGEKIKVSAVKKTGVEKEITELNSVKKTSGKKEITELNYKTVVIDSITGTNTLNLCDNPPVSEIESGLVKCLKKAEQIYAFKWNYIKPGAVQDHGSAKLTEMEFNLQTIKDLFKETPEPIKETKGLLWCNGVENAETGPEAYKKYGFDKILWDWKAASIKADTCENYFCDAAQFMLNTMAKQKELQANLSKIPANHVKEIYEAVAGLQENMPIRDILPIVKKTIIVTDNSTDLATETPRNTKTAYYLKGNSVIGNDCKVQYFDTETKEGTFSGVALKILEKMKFHTDVLGFNYMKYLENLGENETAHTSLSSLGILNAHAKKCDIEGSTNNVLLIIGKNAYENAIFKQMVDAKLIDTDKADKFYILTMNEFIDLLNKVNDASTFNNVKAALQLSKGCPPSYKVTMNGVLLGVEVIGASDKCEEQNLTNKSLWSNFFEGAIAKNLIDVTIGVNASTVKGDEKLMNRLWSEAEDMEFNGVAINPVDSVYLIADNFEAADFKKDFKEVYKLDLENYPTYHRPLIVEKGISYLDPTQEDKTSIESGSYLRMINFDVMKKQDNTLVFGGNQVITVEYAKMKNLADLDADLAGKQAYSKNYLLKMPFNGTLGEKDGKREGYGIGINVPATIALKLTENLNLTKIAGDKTLLVSLFAITEISGSSEFASIYAEALYYNTIIPTLITLDSNKKQNIALSYWKKDLPIKGLVLKLMQNNKAYSFSSGNLDNFKDYSCSKKETDVLKLQNAQGEYKGFVYSPTEEVDKLADSLKVTCAKEKVKLSSRSWGSPQKQEITAQNINDGLVSLVTANPKVINNFQGYLAEIYNSNVCVQLQKADGTISLLLNPESILKEIEGTTATTPAGVVIQPVAGGVTEKPCTADVECVATKTLLIEQAVVKCIDKKCKLPDLKNDLAVKVIIPNMCRSDSKYSPQMKFGYIESGQYKQVQWGIRLKVNGLENSKEWISAESTNFETTLKAVIEYVNYDGYKLKGEPKIEITGIFDPKQTSKDKMSYVCLKKEGGYDTYYIDSKAEVKVDSYNKDTFTSTIIFPATKDIDNSKPKVTSGLAQ